MGHISVSGDQAHAISIIYCLNEVCVFCADEHVAGLAVLLQAWQEICSKVQITPNKYFSLIP